MGEADRALPDVRDEAGDARVGGGPPQPVDEHVEDGHVPRAEHPARRPRRSLEDSARQVELEQEVLSLSHEKAHPSPSRYERRMRRATTIRWTSSGPS